MLAINLLFNSADNQPNTRLCPCTGSEAMEAIVRKNPEINRHVSFDTLTPHLNRHNVFNPDEIRQLNNSHLSTSYRANLMVEWIQMRSDEDALNFILALHDSAHQFSGHQVILKALKVTVVGDEVYHDDS